MFKYVNGTKGTLSKHNLNSSNKLKFHLLKYIQIKPSSLGYNRGKGGKNFTHPQTLYIDPYRCKGSRKKNILHNFWVQPSGPPSFGKGNFWTFSKIIRKYLKNVFHLCAKNGSSFGQKLFYGF